MELDEEVTMKSSDTAPRVIESQCSITRKVIAGNIEVIIYIYR